MPDINELVEAYKKLHPKAPPAVEKPKTEIPKPKK